MDVRLNIEVILGVAGVKRSGAVRIDESVKAGGVPCPGLAEGGRGEKNGERESSKRKVCLP